MIKKIWKRFQFELNHFYEQPCHIRQREWVEDPETTPDECYQVQSWAWKDGDAVQLVKGYVDLVRGVKTPGKMFQELRSR